ncbi:hypothetical protein [Palleronia sp.]|uniref:hypothetical protein n=1 Tax=Palleronia sp. TaxID=1940284 RepID=UPI0035C84020
MFDGSVITLVVLYLCAFGAYTLLHGRVGISFFWLSAAVFLVYILPKFGAYLLTGDDVFLPGTAVLSQNTANAAVVCITAFMATILVCYFTAVIVLPEGPARVTMNRPLDPDQAASIGIWLFVPIFGLSFCAYWIAAQVSFDNLFAKRELILDGDRTVAWALQKIAQVVKAGLYLALLATLTVRDGRYNRHVLFLGALSVLVYVVSSQRSGILVLALEIALVFQIAGIMKPRHYLILAGSFVALNIAILSARALDTAQAMYWSDMIYRRYFFDLEKIAALIEYFVSDPLYRFDSLGILVAGSNGIRPDYATHHFLGEQVFGVASGVPPSVLGEMIIYGGPISIVPVTAALTAIVIWFERCGRATGNPIMQLVLVVVLSKLYFLTLNSDFSSSINRIVLDLALLGTGLAGYALVGGRIDNGTATRRIIQ